MVHRPRVYRMVLRTVSGGCGTHGRVEVLRVAQQVPADSAFVLRLDIMASPPVTTFKEFIQVESLVLKVWSPDWSVSITCELVINTNS